jgi:hypothetical protein
VQKVIVARTRARQGLSAALVVALSLLGSAVLAPPSGALSLAVSFTLTPISFGSVTEGTSMPGQSLLTNTSAAPIYFVRAAPNASNTLAEFHGSVGTCAGPIAPGATCDIAVTFTPHNLRMRSSTVFVTMATHTAKGLVARVNTVGTKVQGFGVKPSFTLSDASAGNINVGSIGTASATITNNSLVGLDIVKVNIITTLYRTWGVAAVACPHVIAPNSSCSIVVSFSPHHIGTVTATLHVAMVVDGTTVPVGARSTLTGTGVPKGGRVQKFTLTPVQFGSVTVGSSASGDVVLTNTSPYPESLAHDGITSNFSGSFSITGTSCTAPLATGASCAIHVLFAPTGGTLFNSTFVAVVNQTVGAVTTPHGGLASLSGRGIAPTFTLGLPTYPTTTVGSSNDQQVLVTNTSLVALTFVHAGLVGSNVSSWVLTSTPCAGTLAPNASCSLDLVFAPRHQGLLSITLNVTMQFGVSPHIHLVLAQGDPTATAILPSFSVSSPSLASAVKGSSTTATATITNNSSEALAYFAFSISGANAGDFSVTGTTCVAQIAPSGSCDLTVQFSPTETVAGTDTANLHVVLDILGTTPPIFVTQDVALSAQVTA